MRAEGSKSKPFGGRPFGDGLPLRPADVVIIACNTLAAAIVTWGRPEGWEASASTFMALALAPLLLARIEQRWPNVITHEASSFYPAVVCVAMYYQLNPLCNMLHQGLADSRLQEIDRLLFHVQPAVWLAPHLGPWINNFLMTCYASYYLWAVIVGVVYQLRRDEVAYSRWTLAFVVYFMLNFLGYCLVPAEGPRFMLAGAFAHPIEGQWAAFLAEAFRKSPFARDCFPSGHTALTLMVLYETWKRQRKVFWAILPWNLGLIVSTVACRFHYGIDLVAAVPLALISLWAADSMAFGFPWTIFSWRRLVRTTQ
jgi:membrane-associated phospholipid phosphatase